MNHNRLAGSLPQSWGNYNALNELRVLSLRNNSLSGSLPDAWGNSYNALAALEIMVADGNQLSGTLPNSWDGGWRNLTCAACVKKDRMSLGGLQPLMALETSLPRTTPLSGLGQAHTLLPNPTARASNSCRVKDDYTLSVPGHDT